ncbi:BrnA antitoxin family protein [Methylobacterium sp. J-070]|uniref:BrnA antitoxin family protein n=1 Tax=Methylobacterium sp. J-070 TaxID=2836650 RepID=UPI001FB90F9B|nr:BrnA antitoxin family protein [Methylobacterium sp. J-070]MCJ2050180.1 BrnA antitoxin family protein [Methylobacterium sp. J-070]
MPKLDLPPITDADEAWIQAGIAADPDNPEVTAEQARDVRPFAEAFPELDATLRRSRGPQKAPTKQLVSLRLDVEIVEAFKATGPGWQTRMNDALRAAARTLTPA